MEILKQLASTEVEGGESGSILEMLGIDWMTLLFQIGAFLVLVWILGKFVFPWLMKSVDERQAKIEASAKMAAEAQVASEKAEERISKLLADAQNEASQIIESAKIESAEMISRAEEKSKKRAEQIVIDAQTQIKKDVLIAKNFLHNETVKLVALATEKVVGKVITDEIDNELILESIKEVE